jgi:endonuclease YncB( thermonuclease family)
MVLLAIFTLVLVQERQLPARDESPRRVGQDLGLVAEEVFQATVTAVEDGDSLIVKSLAGGDTSTVHIAGVDAPELTQPGGEDAKTFLRDLVAGRTVTVRLTSVSERLARIEINGSDISVSLIKAGMAWHCPRFADESDLTAAEADARQARRGFWKLRQPTPPWLHRGVGACWQQKTGGKAATMSRPDFSGTWTTLTPADQAGEKLTITQNESSLSLQRASDRGGQTVVYKLEGTTSRALSTSHGPIDIVAKSHWQNGAWIVDERQWLVPGEEATNIRRILWLDERGFLNLEVSSPRPIGETDARRVVLKRESRN